jgi:NAD(P)-dependent dehydrogenase (short-subunit alcohol dehydrogenase family)
MSVVLITGCSSGFGLETALAFARRGDATYASMRDPQRATVLLQRAKAEGLDLEVLALDVTDEASVATAVRHVEDRHAAVDILVNNAGFDHAGPVETIPIERARAMFETNLWGPVRTSRAVLPAMRARRSGVIVNVSSIAGRIPPNPYGGFYAASKHALGVLSESLASEVGIFGIRVVCLEPSFFATGITERAWPEDQAHGPYGSDYAWIRAFISATVAKLGADPSIVAGAAVHVADDPSTPLHVLVGEDASMYVDLAARAGGYEGWVAATAEVFASVVGPRPAPAAANPLARSRESA